jgi:predicted ATPase
VIASSPPLTPIKTAWLIITGAPSSGKTSVIHELQKRGYQTKAEMARAVIEARLQNGESLSDITRDKAKLQNEMLSAVITREDALDPQIPYFIDRGAIDSIAYLRFYGLDDTAAHVAAQKYRYAAVFHLARLPFVADKVRIENEATAAALESHILTAYLDHGYTPIPIPVMTIAERADMILNNLHLSSLS